MAKHSIYLSIGETARRSGVATSALRFYERRCLISSIRTGGNQRQFHRSMLRRISVIRIAQTLGLSLDDIADALATLPDGRTPTKQDWQRLSTKWRHQLDERISGMQQMREKLTGCIGCGCLSMRSCSLYNADDRAAKGGAGPRYLLGDSPEVD